MTDGIIAVNNIV